MSVSFLETVRAIQLKGLMVPQENSVQTRSDLTWALSVGGITTVSFAIFVLFAWYFSATLFLIFAGILLGVGLNALTELFGRLMGGPHALRLTMVCLVLAALLAGAVFLGGATIADQAKVLSTTLKSQIVNVKSFLDQHGIDTSYFDIGNIGGGPDAPAKPEGSSPSPALAKGAGGGNSSLPSAGTIASSGGAIVSQTLKIILGAVGALGNFFIVLFLGLSFAAQPSVYRKGLLHLTPKRHKGTATTIIDNISGTLERWLIAQMITMVAVGAVTWIGLMLIGVPSAFILGVLAGLIVVLASLASGWVAAASACVLFLGVHAMESYVLTPILQRQALDIPAATLFAFQILLGVVFGVWGLALALPVLAIVKVIIDFLREKEETSAQDLIAA
jgi:predicted PurR-regulated permease PerM